MSMQLDERTDVITHTVLDEDDPKHSHYVERSAKQSAEARVFDAMVNGTPITALCGYVWIPHRDPAKLPVCPKCEEILAFAKNMRG